MCTIVQCSLGLPSILDTADLLYLQNKMTLGSMHTASRLNQIKTKDTELHRLAPSLIGCVSTSAIQPQPLEVWLPCAFPVLC